MSEVKGVNEVNRFFDKFLTKVDKVVTKQLLISGEEILEESNKIAPKDSGEMIRQTDVIEKKPDEVHIRYNTDYSLYVHEDLEKIHPNGQAKFLEQATVKKYQIVPKNIANGIKKIR